MTTTLAIEVLDRPAQSSLAKPPYASRCPVTVYLGSLGSPESRRTMHSALCRLVEIMTGIDPAAAGDRRVVDARGFPWAQLRAEHVSTVRAGLLAPGEDGRPHYAPATANRLLAALRGVLRAAWRLELIDSDTYHRAADVERVKGHTLPRGRALDLGEIRALLAAAADANGPIGLRDLAIIALGYGCGLRRSEVVGLNLEDCTAEAASIRVLGKGRKERMVYPVNGARDALTRWMGARGDHDGPLFHPIRKGGAVATDRRLTPAAVRLILRRAAERAEVGECSPHDLRRSFISAMLDAGADISQIQGLAGHSDVSTTQRYDHRPEESRRRAAGLILVPIPAPKGVKP